MYATYPIYYPSARWARENGEIGLWRESYKINKECKNYLNMEASVAYHQGRLPDFIKRLTELYGLERAMYVIGRTIIGSDWDKRYYEDVKKRAERFDYRDMKEIKALQENGQDPHRTADNTTSYISDVHPVMLNAVFRHLMEMEREQAYLLSIDADRVHELDGEVGD